MGLLKSHSNLFSRHRKGGAILLLRIMFEGDQKNGRQRREGEEMTAIAIAHGGWQGDQCRSVINPGGSFELRRSGRKKIAFN